MSIGIGQILIIVLIILIISGRLPRVFEDIMLSIQNLKSSIENKKNTERIEQGKKDSSENHK